MQLRQAMTGGFDANGAPMAKESHDQVYVFALVKIHNESKQPLFLHNIMTNATLSDAIHSSYAATPVDYERAAKDAAAGLLRESHHFEAKRSVEPGNSGKSKIDKALSAFSIDGGTFAVGVNENEHNVIDGLTPFELGDLRERILQVAAQCDPPVQPNIQVIREHDGGSTGIVLVHIPISPAAPHKAAAPLRTESKRRFVPIQS